MVAVSPHERIPYTLLEQEAIPPKCSCWGWQYLDIIMLIKKKIKLIKWGGHIIRTEDNFWRVCWPANTKWQSKERRIGNNTQAEKRGAGMACENRAVRLTRPPAQHCQPEKGTGWNHSSQTESRVLRGKTHTVWHQRERSKKHLSVLQWTCEHLDQSSRKWSLRVCHIWGSEQVADGTEHVPCSPVTWYNCDRLSMWGIPESKHALCSPEYMTTRYSYISQQKSKGPHSKWRQQPPKPEKHLFPWLSAP